MTPHELALKLAVLRVLSDHIKDARTTADEQARETLHAGDRITAALPDGSKVAAVSLANGRKGAKVVDEAAFTAWVTARHPDEVVPTIRDSFKKKVLDAVKADGGMVDRTTGELVEIPGVEPTEGDPYPSVRLAPGAAELVQQAWTDGTLAHVLAEIVTPAIEGGDG